MQTPINPFKKALAERRAQIGLWQGLASSYTAEICAGAGFDWLLIDGEHSPNDLMSVLQQAQAIAAYPATHPIARIPLGHGHVGQMLIKQYLDLGIQTLLVPMVDTPEQAREIVRQAQLPVYVIGLGTGNPYELSDTGDKIYRYADVLNLLASVSGGRYYAISNLTDLQEALVAIHDDLRHQYVLGFATGEGKSRLRDVKVEVKSGDRTVLFRRGYKGPPPAESKGG